MDNSFKTLIDASQSILVILPTKPYLDQIAGALSLYLSLKSSKEITVFCPSDIIVEFNRLVAVDRIVREVGNRNLVITFKDYQAQDIERVSYDIENKEFKLTVIPKTESGFSFRFKTLALG